MALREEFEKLGNWFFRWRSYLPLVLTIFFLTALIANPGNPTEPNRPLEFFCLAVALLGLGVRMYAVGCAPKGTSGRNTKEQRAYELNKTGIYSLVRHPLYLGNFLMWFGIALFTSSWMVILATVFFFWFYYEKIMFADEEFLRREFGDTYLKWAEKTPPFFPTRWSSWKRPALPFSWKNALRREYSGFFAIISSFGLMKLIGDSAANREIFVDTVWLAVFLAGLIIYISLMFLKKKTTLLDVKGR